MATLWRRDRGGASIYDRMTRGSCFSLKTLKSGPSETNVSGRIGAVCSEKLTIHKCLIKNSRTRLRLGAGAGHSWNRASCSRRNRSPERDRAQTLSTASVVPRSYVCASGKRRLAILSDATSPRVGLTDAKNRTHPRSSRIDLRG